MIAFPNNDATGGELDVQGFERFRQKPIPIHENSIASFQVLGKKGVRILRRTILCISNHATVLSSRPVGRRQRLSNDPDLEPCEQGMDSAYCVTSAVIAPNPLPKVYAASNSTSTWYATALNFITPDDEAV